MDNLELNKEFMKFKEICDLIIKSEYTLKQFSRDFSRNLTNIEKLKFICLKYDLCDVYELENLSNLEKEETLEFCSNLKEHVCHEFINKISDK